MRDAIRWTGVTVVLVAFACVLTTAAAARTLAAPTVSNFTPKSGPIGTRVTIAGSNLAGARVTFNGAQASAVTVNKWGNALVATVPYDSDALQVGTGVQIAVTTAEGTAMPATTFMVTAATTTPRMAVPKPRVATFAPVVGKPGMIVTIRGTGLGGALAVRFGGVKAIFRVPSQTKVVATVPRNAKTGKLSVQTNAGTGVSTRRFTVVPGPRSEN
jgi:hypothetical protein